MRVYFVRHGTTEANERNVSQGSNEPLSPHGKRQSALLATRFKKITLDQIISSDHLRARETADEISKQTGIPVTISRYFREVRRPSELDGISYDSEEYLQAFSKIENNWHKKGWKYSDEESFHEMKERAIKALAYIVKSKKDDVLVVSHGNFLKALIGVMIKGGKHSAEDFRTLRLFLDSSNVGISLCEYTDGKWRMITWNDHAHLG
jgi:2,3-bisphosphoglycerate-dependent phosphoglycerate mutase